MREDPWPDALEDVVAGSRNHLDAATEALLPPGRPPLTAVVRPVQEECLRAHCLRLGLLERRRGDEDETADDVSVPCSELDRTPSARADTDDRRRRTVPLGRELDVALGGLGWIGVGCRPSLGETEEDGNYERGLVFSGS